MLLTSDLENDYWEILPEHLEMQSIIGEGAFGLVRKGWLKDFSGNTTMPVAIKMLRGTLLEK